MKKTLKYVKNPTSVSECLKAVAQDIGSCAFGKDTLPTKTK